MPNDPYLDASVRWKIKSGNALFHEPGYREVADAILDVGIATEVRQKIGSGKEADVYLCFDGGRPVAVKFYRLFRTSHKGGGTIKSDSMGHRASREFELLAYAWQDGAAVPRPYRRVENMVSMQYLGTPEGPALLLQHAELTAPARFLAETVRAIERLAEAGVVHSDLSPFNVIVFEEKPWIIDLAACFRVDRLGESPWIRLTEATVAIRHGLNAMARYFRRYGLDLEVDEVVNRVIVGLDRFGVLRA